MSSRRIIRTLGLAALCLLCLPVACQKVGNGSGSGNGNDPTGSPLQVRIQSKEDGSAQVISVQTCSVPAGSAAGTIVNCSASVPSGALYNSQLLITVSTDSTTACDQVEFAPYYYQASNQAAFLPEWQTSAVDCTALPLNAACFSGAATSVVPGFPAVRSVSQSSAQGLSQSFTVPSAKSSGRLSNRWAANDLSSSATSTLRASNLFGAAATKPVADNYLANTFHDYTFTCRDAFSRALSQIVLTVSPRIDSTGTANVNDPTVNLFPSWVGTLAPQPLQALNLSPFQLVVQTSEETNANILTTFQTCSVPASASPGGNGSAINCQAQIPQAQLFYSKLVLTMNAASPQSCYQIITLPYYYISSNTSATYQPPWSTSSTDCTKLVSNTSLPSNNTCLGGPAPIVVSGWPQKGGIYQLTSTSLSLSTTIPSANSQNWVSNRWASNDLPAAQRTKNLSGANSKNQNGVLCSTGVCPVPESYVANSFRDYQFLCVDKFDQNQYSITLTVSEIVSGNQNANANDPSINVYPDWMSTLAPQ